jgi:hypothetical protein
MSRRATIRALIDVVIYLFVKGQGENVVKVTETSRTNKEDGC